MAGRIRIRAQLKNGATEVKALMRHPMETGLRKDLNGEVIPEHYITELKAVYQGRVVMSAFWGAAVSHTPFVGFVFEGGSVGEEGAREWGDNLGETGAGTTLIR